MILIAVEDHIADTRSMRDLLSRQLSVQKVFRCQIKHNNIHTHMSLIKLSTDLLDVMISCSSGDILLSVFQPPE